MKKTFLIFAIITLAACNNTDNSEPAPLPPCCLVRNLSVLHVASFKYAPNASNLKIEIVNSCSASPSYDNLSESFEEQIVQYRGYELQEGESYGYANAQLKEISLVADDVFNGRQAGEELIDLFEILCRYPLFDFNDKSLVYYADKETPLSDNWHSLIDYECFAPRIFYLRLVENKIERIERIVNFTLKITYFDRYKEFSMTKPFSIEFYGYNH